MGGSNFSHSSSEKKLHALDGKLLLAFGKTGGVESSIPLLIIVTLILWR
jgi:hypothetical protein